ncbi:hypothetical protein [Granulicella sibirica]|uniref:DoxX family protein n=1 Tax=Granulicella sibirica TaxID=2479048 RepID=A0A4Q0T156_9BACT|nr:hypothetical protein [Granulicella sibirica]RXH55136.1 hypothetical protein GRAN_4240 [Granulicella sibirica]
MPSPLVLLPCLTGLIFLALGLTLNRKRLAENATPTLPRLILIGPIFYGASLGVFGTEHFTVARFIQQGVPTWIPFPLFWTYVVGIGLLAAGLSILANRVVWLSAPLLAGMIFLFVLTIHLPRLAHLHDRVSLAVLLRDTAFAGTALILTALHRPRTPWLAPLGRATIAIAAIVFAAIYIGHPQTALGLPLEMLSPAWLPAPHTFATIGAILLFVSGAAILAQRRIPLAAAVLGSWLTLVTVAFYLPIFFMAKGTGAQIEGMNYVADTLMFAGTALIAGLRPEAPESTIR